MIEVANRIAEVKEYYFSKKLDEIREMNSRGCDVLNLGIGSPDLPPARQVTDKLMHSASQANTHAYQSYRSIPELRDAIAGFYRRHYNVNLNSTTEILPLLGFKRRSDVYFHGFSEPWRYGVDSEPGIPRLQNRC